MFGLPLPLRPIHGFLVGIIKKKHYTMTVAINKKKNIKKYLLPLIITTILLKKGASAAATTRSMVLQKKAHSTKSAQLLLSIPLAVRFSKMQLWNYYLQRRI